MIARTRLWRTGTALLICVIILVGCAESKETEVTFGSIGEVQDGYKECISATQEEDNLKMRQQLQVQCKQVFDRAIAAKEKVLESNPNKVKGPFNIRIKQKGIKLQLTDVEGNVLIKLGEALAPLAGAGKILTPVPGTAPSAPTTPPRLEQRPANGVLRSDRAQEFFYGVAEVTAAGQRVDRFFLFPLETVRGDDGWYNHTVTFWPAPDWAAYATSGMPLEMSLMIDIGVETDITPLDVRMVEIFEVGGTMVPWATYTFTVRPTEGALMQETTAVDSASLEETITAWKPPIKAVRRYFSDVPRPQEGLFNLLARLGIYQGYPDGTARPDADITRAEFAAVALRVMGREALATELAAMRPAYSDEVPQWAWGYINAATELGLMQGFPDGTIGAGLPVTHVQSWAILIRTLGADQDEAAKGLGAWPTNYAEAAATLDLTRGMGFANDLNASRGSTSLFAYQTLFTNRRLDSEGQITLVTSPSAVQNLGVYRFAAFVGEVDTNQASLTLDRSVEVGGSPIGPAVNLAAAFSIAGATTLGDVVEKEVYVYILNQAIIGVEVF